MMTSAAVSVWGAALAHRWPSELTRSVSATAAASQLLSGCKWGSAAAAMPGTTASPSTASAAALALRVPVAVVARPAGGAPWSLSRHLPCAPSSPLLPLRHAATSAATLRRGVCASAPTRRDVFERLDGQLESLAARVARLEASAGARATVEEWAVWTDAAAVRPDLVDGASVARIFTPSASVEMPDGESAGEPALLI
eukprot:366083-Chlamydomonas_euryale.AAC.3